MLCCAVTTQDGCNFKSMFGQRYGRLCAYLVDAGAYALGEVVVVEGRRIGSGLNHGVMNLKHGDSAVFVFTGTKMEKMEDTCVLVREEQGSLHAHTLCGLQCHCRF
jgi:hypothetical protein